MSTPAINATNRTSIEISGNRCCFPCCPRKHHKKPSRRDSQIDATIKIAEALRAANPSDPAPIVASPGGLHTPEGFKPGAWPSDSKWVPMPPKGSLPSEQTGC